MSGTYRGPDEGQMVSSDVGEGSYFSQGIDGSKEFCGDPVIDPSSFLL